MYYDDPSRSARPEWPNDMLITEERRDAQLMPLVYAHAAWGLDLERAFTDLIANPVPQAPPALSRAELQREWRRIYDDTVRSRADVPIADGPADPNMFAKMQRWSRTAPQTIDNRFPEAWGHEAYEAWLDDVAPTDAEIDYPDALLPVLVEAWRSGLRSITILPLANEFGLRTCLSEVVVSTRVRESELLLRGALAAR